MQVESQHRPSARAQRFFERLSETSLMASRSSSSTTTSASTISALMQQRFDEHPKCFTDKQCK